MKKAIPSPVLCISALLLLLLAGTSVGDPRPQIVNMTCRNQLYHNATIYVPNFVATMENIRVQMRESGFGKAVTGSGPDTNFGLAQCYGDLSSLDCVLCYAEARTVLPQCYPNNGGRIFLDGCFMRAENYSFFQEYAGPEDHAVCGNTTRKNATTFQASARQAVQQAVANALINNGYARAEVTVAGRGNESAYVLADCWKTLNVNACKACLENASASILGCLPSSEGRALNTGCFMRYSDINFLNSSSGNGSSKGTVIIIAAVIGSVVVLAIGAVIAVYYYKHREIEKKRRGSNDAKKISKKRRERKQLGALPLTVNNSKLNFSYEILEKATNYFHSSNKLGQGGSGSVFKGILPDGRVVAIKRLIFNTTEWVDHFFNEVNLISGLDHKNLVKLLGYSITGPESLLVYEFVPNQSLNDHLSARNDVRPLNWEERYKIILGTAEGLAHLHEESTLRIIHRDIKLSNILLEEDCTPKIADFGLARLFPEDKSHISTGVAGTVGYMAPEYIVRGKLTEKADVYSFGVVVIEVVSGKKNNSFSKNSYSMLQMVWNLYGKGRLREVVDPSLRGEFEEEEATRVLQIGLLCVQAAAETRPSMLMVVTMLRDNHEIPQPTKPPFLNNISAEITRHEQSGHSHSKPESCRKMMLD